MTTAPAIDAQPKGKAWHSQSAEEVLAQLGSASDRTFCAGSSKTPRG